MEHVGHDKRTILLIDDDREQALLGKYTLEKNGYTVEIAVTGGEALRLLSTQSFSIFLIDYRLPDMTGIELYKKISAIRPHPFSIIVTGSGSEDIAVQAMQAGVDDYIVKSVNLAHFEILPQVIANAFERRKILVDHKHLLSDTEDLKKEVDSLLVQLGRPKKYF